MPTSNPPSIQILFRGEPEDAPGSTFRARNRPLHASSFLRRSLWHGASLAPSTPPSNYSQSFQVLNGIAFSQVVAGFLVCVVLAPAFAAEGKKSFKEASTEAGKATVNYPANVVGESVNVVGTAAKNTTGVVVDTVKATGETLTGDVKKAPEIVTTPVKGSAETVKDAAVGTVEMPVKAGKKTAEQSR